MKKIIYFIAVVVVLLNTTACNEILDQMPNDTIPGDVMWTSEAQVDQGVIGVYSSLQRPVEGREIVGSGDIIGYYGLEVFGMGGQGSYAIHNFFTSGVNPGNTRFAFTWKWCYDGIHRANDAIKNIPGVNMDANKKAKLIAECKILRAFFYSRLNELYGNGGIGVPIYTEPVLPSEAINPQSPENEVWKLVVDDLTEAINEANLPDNQINKEGRTSKGAAYALRGRAYLNQKEYDKAIADFAKVGDCGYALYPDYKALFKVDQERCEEMILNVQYIEEPAGYGSQLQKFSAAFQQGSKDSRGCWTDLQVAPAVVDLYEVVVNATTVKPFQWVDFIPQWNSVTNVEERKVFFVRDSLVNNQPIHTTISNSVSEQVNSLPAPVKALYLPQGNEARVKAAYDNRDPRLGYNVLTPYSDFLGVNSNSTSEGWYTSRWPVTGKYYLDQADAEPNLNPNLPPTYYTSGSANASAKFYYMHRKFIGEGLEFARQQDNPVDEPIIRYADVLLLWAEALVEKGDLSGAMSKVKLVRDRAGVPTMSSSFSDQNAARNYVRDERRRELMGEGVNFLDEIRWKTLKETKFDTHFPQLVWGGNAGGTEYQWIGDHWYTWPVPRAETEFNKNLKKTPGWVY